MRRKTALVVAGAVCVMTGCGVAVSGAGSCGTGNGLVLADGADGGRFLLNVTSGTPELVRMGGSGAAADSDPGLIDGVTGTVYSLGVSRGALTLTQAAAGVAGVPQMEFVDAVTEKPYALAVVRGGLTLIPR